MNIIRGTCHIPAGTDPKGWPTTFAALPRRGDLVWGGSEEPKVELMVDEIIHTTAISIDKAMRTQQVVPAIIVVLTEPA